MRVLVTGGAGYIGSHTSLALLRRGHDVVVIDDLSNSSPEALERVGQLAQKRVDFHELDLRQTTALSDIIGSTEVDVAIHFAGLKAVGESITEPLRYYDVNLGATVSLCAALREHGVRRLLFSSSATVYGDAAGPDTNESVPLRPTNPYGQTKAMIEQVLGDLVGTGDEWRISVLRYFNPVGADESGLIGESPTGQPNNLLPFVAQVAVGRLSELTIFGNDYATPDGTGVRDYIHVSDLADGHLAALKHEAQPNTMNVYNLGSGNGYSVLDVIRAFEQASGVDIPYRFGPRRPGDIADCWADPRKASRELGWRTSRNLHQMCVDAWRWQLNNPQGYA